MRYGPVKYCSAIWSSEILQCDIVSEILECDMVALAVAGFIQWSLFDRKTERFLNMEHALSLSLDRCLKSVHSRARL